MWLIPPWNLITHTGLLRALALYGRQCLTFLNIHAFTWKCGLAWLHPFQNCFLPSHQEESMSGLTAIYVVFRTVFENGILKPKWVGVWIQYWNKKCFFWTHSLPFAGSYWYQLAPNYLHSMLVVTACLLHTQTALPTCSPQPPQADSSASAPILPSPLSIVFPFSLQCPFRRDTLALPKPPPPRPVPRSLYCVCLKIWKNHNS